MEGTREAALDVIPRNDIAQYASAASRECGTFQGEGVISTAGGGVCVSDFEGWKGRKGRKALTGQ